MNYRLLCAFWRSNEGVGKFCLLLLSSLFFLFLPTGCGKKEPPAKPEVEKQKSISPAETNRLVDAVYQKKLEEAALDRMKKVSEREKTRESLRAIEKRIRASLPPKASEQAFRTACGKDREWARLSALLSTQNTSLKKEVEAAREMIKSRMVQESRKRQELDASQKKTLPSK